MSISLGEAEQCRAYSVTVALWNEYSSPSGQNPPHSTQSTTNSFGPDHSTSVTTVTYEK